ncbi:MAG: GSCFA domain-containing protein [Muribaculum sp.]|nr:GSCFA domain-containing protein [Muribaculum sp.]
MKFRTEYKVTPSPQSLDPHKPILLIGSCFSDNIGRKMQECLWPAIINPCGVLYNPLSIGRTIINALMPKDMQRAIIEKNMFQRDGIWLSWLFDSSIWAHTASEYVEKALLAYDIFNRAAHSAQAMIVTLGTAFVYRLVSNGEVVCNCHKQPKDRFERSMLNVHEISDWSVHVNEGISNRLADLRLIQTVSPVRHLADGFVQNSLSKAVLRIAADNMEKSRFKMEYFPAYEIVNDDLRDYRFYGPDLAHPSQEAIDYIWDKFLETFLDADGMATVRRGHELYLRSQHRPLFPDTEADRRFREETDRLIKDFQSHRESAS